MIWPILEATAEIQKYFCPFFGSNEDIQKSFWNYLNFSRMRIAVFLQIWVIRTYCWVEIQSHVTTSCSKPREFIHCALLQIFTKNNVNITYPQNNFEENEISKPIWFLWVGLKKMHQLSKQQILTKIPLTKNVCKTNFPDHWCNCSMILSYISRHTLKVL